MEVIAGVKGAIALIAAGFFMSIGFYAGKKFINWVEYRRLMSDPKLMRELGVSLKSEYERIGV